MNNCAGFEYQNRGGKTVFETFLKYTNEKEKSSVVLGEILGRTLIKEGMTFLDVGSGNGEYLKLSLNKVKCRKMTKFTLLEPSKDLVKQLRLTVKKSFSHSTVKVVCSTFEKFTTDNQFDVILASHVPLAKDQICKLPTIFEKLIGLLKPDGCLIVVLRGEDDIHQFRTEFKSQLVGQNYQSLTIDDAVGILRKFSENMPLQISTFSADAELHLPYPDNMQDVISIVEFLLNKKWEEFPNNIHEAVLDYIKQKKGILHQTDGFALVRKICPNQKTIKP